MSDSHIPSARFLPSTFWSSGWNRPWRSFAGPFLSGIAALAGGAAIANLVSIATAPICTRIYAPSDFGVFAQFAAITGILLPLASLGFEIAIPLEKDNAGVNAIAQLCVLIVATVALLSAFLFILGPTFAPRWIDPSLARYWWIALITVAASGYYQMATYLAMRTRAYGLMGKTTFQQAIASGALQVIGGLAVSGPGALLLSAAVASGLGGHRLVRSSAKTPSLWRAKWSRSQIIAVIRKYWSMAGAALSASSLNTVAGQLPVLMISAAYGLKVCGLFVLAARLVSVTDRVITASVARTYYNEAALRFAEDPRSLRSLFVKAVLALAIVGTVGGLAIWILAPSVIRLVFGPGWAEAGLYARYLAPRFVGTMICSPVSETTFILGRPMSKAVLEVIRLSSSATLFWFCQATQQSFSFALLGFSILHLSIGLLWVVMMMRWINEVSRACNSLVR